MHFHIDARPRLHEDNVRAQAARIGHIGTGFNAEALGLDTGGDAASGVRQHRQNAERPPAQLRAQVLLHRGEIGVEVEK